MIQVKYKPSSKKMQFIIKYTMLLQIDPSQVQAANKKAIYYEYTTSLHIDPSQVLAPHTKIYNLS